MGATVIPYEPYHPHLGYTLALTCVAWVAVYLYNRYALYDRPRTRVVLVGIAIGPRSSLSLATTPSTGSGLAPVRPLAACCRIFT